MIMDDLMGWDDSDGDGNQLSSDELEALRVDALSKHNPRNYALYCNILGIPESSIEDVELYQQGMDEIVTVSEAVFEPIRVQLPSDFDIKSGFGGLVEKIVKLTGGNRSVNVLCSIAKRPNAGGVDVTANYTLGESISTVFLGNYDNSEADSSGSSAARSYLMSIFPGSTAKENKIIIRGKYTLDNLL